MTLFEKKIIIANLMKNFRFDSNDRFRWNNREKRARSAINEWFTLLEKDELVFFLKALKNYRYYSGTTVGKTFESLVIKRKFSHIKKILKSDSVVCLPLKKKNSRTETSIAIFINFMNALGINSLKTGQENTFKWFENMQKLDLQWKELISIDLGKEEKKLDITVQNLEKQKLNLDPKTRKKIDNKITDLKKGFESLKRKKDKLKKLDEDHGYELKAKSVIIVDDFLCSGESTERFLKKASKYLIDLDKIVYLVFLEATDEGKKRVEESEVFIKLNNVQIINIIDSINFEKELSEHELEIFRKKKEKIYRRFGLYDDKRYEPKTLFSSYFNAPNSNYGFISLASKKEWPLPFPREYRGKK